MLNIVVASLTGLSFLPIQAVSDCGWILWKKSETTTVSTSDGGRRVTQGDVVWSPQDGFDQYKNCQGAATGALQGTIEGLRTTKVSDSATIHPGGKSATVIISAGDLPGVFRTS